MHVIIHGLIILFSFDFLVKLAMELEKMNALLVIHLSLEFETILFMHVLVILVIMIKAMLFVSNVIIPGNKLNYKKKFIFFI